METHKKQITIEYYADPLSIRLLGAVNVPANRAEEYGKAFGKLFCKAHGLNSVEAALIDEDGEETDRSTIYR